MPDLKDELRQLADEAARQAQPWPVTDVIREGDRRRRRLNPRVPELVTRGKPGRRMPGWVTPLAAAAAVIALVAVVTTVSGVIRDSGPAGNRPGASTVYAIYQSTVVKGGKSLRGAIIPIRGAASTPGKPIRLANMNADVEITPDGKTIYAVSGGLVIPVNTASGQPGQPIHLPGLSGGAGAGQITINPDGKSAYVTSFFPSDTMTPFRIAGNKPGQPIRLSPYIGAIAFTPDGKTAYVMTGHGVVPINTATNKPGRLIHVTARGVSQIVITPDGKTAYVVSEAGVVPISTATNTPGKLISIRGALSARITPDGKTLYVGTGGGRTSTVVPISTATGAPGKPIRIGGLSPEEMVITPDGHTLYVASSEGPASAEVVPISTASNTASKPIPVGSADVIGITPDGKTLYAASPGKIVPVSTATNQPGQPIRVRIRTGLPSGVIAP